MRKEGRKETMGMLLLEQVRACSSSQVEVLACFEVTQKSFQINQS